MKSKEFNKNIAAKDTKTLISELKKHNLDLQKHRFLVKFRNLKDISIIRKTKKNIARIYTQIGKNIAKSEEGK
jgi:ribosomal protein L29